MYSGISGSVGRCGGRQIGESFFVGSFGELCPREVHYKSMKNNRLPGCTKTARLKPGNLGSAGRLVVVKPEGMLWPRKVLGEDTSSGASESTSLRKFKKGRSPEMIQYSLTGVDNTTMSHK